MAEHEGIWSEYRPTYWDGWSAVKRMGDLVRCRDCEHFVTNIHGSYCKKSISTTSDPNGFCAWGRRADG